jgi:hypothetical protein
LDLYGDAASFEYQLKYWSKQFQWGRESPPRKKVGRNAQKVEDLAVFTLLLQNADSRSSAGFSFWRRTLEIDPETFLSRIFRVM